MRRIKYFHKLTEQEYKEKLAGKLTYGEVDVLYPQPKWCSHPQATWGVMGCWSLVSFMVKNKAYCKDCECLITTRRANDQDRL